MSESEEIKRLREERYKLAYAICGGEDAPGYLDSVDVETLCNVARDNYRDWSAQTEKNIRLEGKVSRILTVLNEIIRFGWPANIETNPEVRMLGGKKPSTAEVWTFPKYMLAAIEAIIAGGKS